MSTKRRFLTIGLLAATAVAAAAGTWWGVQRFSAQPKRFAEVVPGSLYRSGKVTPDQLEHAVRTHGIRTVLSLLDPQAPESVAERAAAERLGVRWLNVPLGGDGSSTAAQRELIKAVLFDESQRPLLVHCAAGANRTGLACGMYRIHRDGWSAAQALAEMRRFSFDDLPKHENLRQALRLEERLAAESRGEPTAITSSDTPAP